MKRLFIILSVLSTIVACQESGKDKQTPTLTPTLTPTPVKLDPNAFLMVNSSVTKTGVDGLETPEYIITNVAFVNRGFLKEDGTFEGVGRSGMGAQEDIYDERRDFEKFRFKFIGSDVILPDSTLGIFFRWVDVCFTVARQDGKRVHPTEVTMQKEIIEDTVAYIPNSVAQSCKTRILESIEAGDFEEVYRIFENDYHFLPITGEQWRKLKADGVE